MSNPPRYLVAGCTPWAKRVYEQTLSKLPGEWGYAEDKTRLDFLLNEGWFRTELHGKNTPARPKYIFFLHWRWKVPAEIVTKYPCIGFHLGKLPEERGGSPVQHRILSGQPRATLTMFRMAEDVDAGRILAEREYVALDGTAEAVYSRAMDAAADMIDAFIRHPEMHLGWEQQGEAHAYKRRTPEDSRLPNMGPLECVYDWIRCVDAEGYPRAFLEYGGLRFEFDRAVLYDGRIKADVVITEVGGG